MLVGWDTETCLIRPALAAPPLVVVSYQIEGQAPQLVHHKDARDLAWWLLDQETTTANGVYDLAVLGAKWPDMMPKIFECVMEGRMHCVQTRQKLIDIGHGKYRRIYKQWNGKLRELRYSLQDLCIRHLGKEPDKDTWRLRYNELYDTPISEWPEGAKQYAGDDAVYALAVHRAQEAESNVNLHNEAAQIQALWAAQLTSAWGFRTDPLRVAQVIRDIDAEQVARSERLIQKGFIRIDGSRDTKFAKRYMLATAGDPQLTDTGFKKVKQKLMTREEALYTHGYVKLDEEACLATNDPWLIDYSQYGQHQLLKSKIQALDTRTPVQAKALLGPQCSDILENPYPIQTRFEVLLETGRTSSSASAIIPNSAAIQNPPRAEGFRECFIPRRGNVIVACDYGMAELVSLAEVCFAWFGFSQLRDALNQGMDPHLLMASQLLGISYEEAVANKKRPDVKEARQMAKAANFGFPGGLGVKRFRDYARGYGLELSLEEAKALKDNWLRTWPEMVFYFKAIKEILASNGRDETQPGDEFPKIKGYIEQHVSRRIRGGVTFSEAANSMFQGLTADAAKAAWFEVSRRCYVVPESALFGFRVVNFVHDELLIEGPEQRAHKAAMELAAVMVEQYQRFTPNTKITAEPSMMRRWSKKAEPAFKDGRLIPWEDAAPKLAA